MPAHYAGGQCTPFMGLPPSTGRRRPAFCSRRAPREGVFGPSRVHYRHLRPFLRAASRLMRCGGRFGCRLPKTTCMRPAFAHGFRLGPAPGPGPAISRPRTSPRPRACWFRFRPKPRYSWSRLTRPRRLLWARIPTFLRRRAGSPANALLQQKEPQMRHNRGPGVQTGCAAAAQAPCPQRANPAPGGRSRRYRHHSRRFHGRLPY